MSSFSQRWLCVFGAFVMMVVVLSGCTDAMVGPADADATDDRIVETAAEATLQHAEPLEAGDSHGVRGRLAVRFSMPPPPESLPPPDSLQAPDSSGTAPMGRLRLPYAMPPPLSLPPDSSSTPPDSTGTGGGGTS